MMVAKNTATLAQRISGKRVYVDTNPIIYFIERSPEFFQSVLPVFELIGDGEISALTSDFTLTEVLLKPLRDGNTELVQDIKDLLLDPSFFTLTDVPRSLLLHAAEIGAQAGLRPADAIHFASAIENHCHFFLTNDRRFKSVKGLDVIQLGDC